MFEKKKKTFLQDDVLRNSHNKTKEKYNLNNILFIISWMESVEF